MRVFRLFWVLSFLLLASAAQAQEAPNLLGDNAVGGASFFDTEDLSVDFNEAFMVMDNDYLADRLRLNYQISLLGRLLERQTQISRIEESMNMLGTQWDAPPPPQGLCAQLPANVPCLKAYPDLYPELVAKRQALHDEKMAQYQAAMKMGHVAITQADETPEQARKRLEAEEKAARERAAKLAKEERRTRYQWSDISCKQGHCQAVLVSPKSAGFRSTVRIGSVLSDGTRIRRVSADGVIVSIEGDTISLRPAPSDADQNDPTSNFYSSLNNAAVRSAAVQKANADIMAAQNAAANILGNTHEGAGAPTQGANASTDQVGATSAQNAETTQSSPAPSAAGQTSATPALGPSGLF